VSKRLEEVEAEHKKKLDDMDDSKKPEDRFKKLSSSELQVLKQRLNAAEARAGTAEARMNQAEKELADARREIEEKELEARTAITEKAQVAAALEAARAANQGHMAEASQRLVRLAKLQTDREMGDQLRGSWHGSGVQTEPLHESKKGLALAAVPPPAATQESLQASRSRMMLSHSAQRSFSPPPQQRAYSPQRTLLKAEAGNRAKSPPRNVVQANVVAQSPALTKSRASPVRMRPSVTAASTGGGHPPALLVAPPTFAAELSPSMTAHRDRWGAPRTSSMSMSGVSGPASCQAPVGSRMSVHAPAVRAM